MHLTLVFLGQVPVVQLDAIRLLLDQACAGQQPFEIEARGTGTFGKPGRPRVVWAGISACPPLEALQHGIVQQLHQADIAFDDKPFSPHLTLGRIKVVDRHLPPLMEKLDHFRESALGRARIAQVALMQSRLTPRGADYAVLHAVELIQGEPSTRRSIRSSPNDRPGPIER